jgi:hypothetical protein
MLALGWYCLRAGHVLWQRLDFTSRVVWVEMQGNYQSARMDVGNTLSDPIKTEKQIINIETMTLRVWAAELDTVIFGKDAPRMVIGLRGLPNLAKQLAAHLAEFAQEQSVVVAPTSQTDLRKSALLGAMNHTGGAVPPAPGSIGAAMQAVASAASPSRAAPMAEALPATCPACGNPVEPGDRFCGSCGKPVGV